MRNRFHAFPCTIVLSLVLSAASSQNIAFTPVELPDENLSGIITCITQDQRGNIWFTCNNSGLFEYDGIRLKSYMHDPLNPHSLANNVLECVYVDNDGYVWVGTYGDGLEKLDTKTGIFTDYKHDNKNPYSISGDTVTCILQDHEGTLWIGNDYTGLDRFDKKTGKFFHYKHKNNDTTSLSFDQVRALYEDREGTLWIGTGAGFGGDENPDNKGGLNRFNKSTGTFTQYLHNDKDPHSLIDNRVRAIYEDTYGNFWVGTSGDGLHTLNRATGKFTRYTYDPKHPERLSRPPVSTAISYDHITFITEDATRKIWIGTLTEGLTRYDPISKKIDRYKLHGTNFNNANDSTAWWAFTSSEGEMWISNFGAHMLRFDPFLQNISQDSSKGSLQSFFQESDSIEWIGTDGKGLARLDKKNNTIKWFVHDPKKSGTISSSNNVFTIYKDKENRLWVATDSGLNLFHPGKEIFSHYLYDPRIKTSISNNFVLPIYEDEKNDLWIGTALGLDKMNPSTGEFTHYKIYPQDSIVGGKNLVTCIAEDNNENLWTGNWSGGGVNLFDSKTHRFKNYLRGQSILGLCVTDNGILWAGSNINGVFRYDNALDSFHLVVDSANGDALAVVSMVKDHNDVWAGGPNGIFRIDGKTNAVARFSKSFGVNLPLNFLAAFKSEEGALIFGNTLGFYSFFPNKLLANNKPPQIVLTDFRTNNQQVQTGENNIFRDAAAIKSIKLNHNQNAFFFSFKVVHYSNSNANKAMYMLENYDKGWRASGSNYEAYYYDIPPGKYTLKIKAASSYGVWAEKDIPIIITPPWWKTWWAYCIIGLLILAVAFAVHRFQKRRILQVERERSRSKELQQAKEIQKAYHELRTTQSQLIQSEKMASLGELTAAIAHEIQNPLNFVNNFSEVNGELISELVDEVDKGNYDEVKVIAVSIKDNEEKIRSHGRRADTIVKGMLQHSRVSSGQKEPTDINALADEYLRLSYHGVRARDKSFNATLETDFDKSLGKINIVPQDIGRVLLNLFNNAFYAVSEKTKIGNENYKPTVTVTTKRHNSPSGDGGIEIRVSDNGAGIPQNIAEKIFQPFFTTKPTGEGTGLGLSLSYDIIKAHGGEIKVNSKEGEGSEFIISLAI